MIHPSLIQAANKLGATVVISQWTVNPDLEQEIGDVEYEDILASNPQKLNELAEQAGQALQSKKSRVARRSSRPRA